MSSCDIQLSEWSSADIRIIKSATLRLEKLLHTPADELREHRLKVLADARAAPNALLRRRDDVFARTYVTEKRAKGECFFTLHPALFAREKT